MQMSCHWLIIGTAFPQIMLIYVVFVIQGRSSDNFVKQDNIKESHFIAYRLTDVALTFQIGHY
jgi:hypothetical protein